jgi:hypothetical protein
MRGNCMFYSVDETIDEAILRWPIAYLTAGAPHVSSQAPP